MITEAFILACNDEKAYLHIDRSYQSGGIILLADALEGVYDDGIDGCSYFEEFTLNNWLNALGITDGIVTFKVLNGCDNRINIHIYKDKQDDILSIIIKNNVVSEVSSSNGEIVYTQGEDYIGDWKVGWLGKIFEYYTSEISFDIEEYVNEYDYIWGVYYPDAYYR